MAPYIPKPGAWHSLRWIPHCQSGNQMTLPVLLSWQCFVETTFPSPVMFLTGRVLLPHSPLMHPNKSAGTTNTPLPHYSLHWLTLVPEAEFKFQTVCYDRPWAGLCLDVLHLALTLSSLQAMFCSEALLYVSRLRRLWVWSPEPQSIKLWWRLLQFPRCWVASWRLSAKGLLDNGSFLGWRIRLLPACPCCPFFFKTFIIPTPSYFTIVLGFSS